MPKQLRIKKSKAAPKVKSTSKKRKATLPKKVAVKKTVLKVIEPVAKKPAPKKVAATQKSTAKPVAKKPAPKKVTARKTPTKPTITKTQMENLKIVEGIGPAIEKILKSKGINTVADLSKTRIGILRTIMDEAGSRFRIHKPDTWARQARLAAAGKFDELKEWQKELNGGKK